MVTIIYNHETDLKCLLSGRWLHIHCHYCAVSPMNQSRLSVLFFSPWFIIYRLWYIKRGCLLSCKL